MGHYLSNLRDLQFNLFEVLGSDTVLGTGPFKDLDGDTAREVLLEVDRLAREVLAEPFVDSDRHPPTFDPRTFTAATGERFKAAYDAWMAAEFWRLQLDEELGGTLAPSVMNWALAELVLGANPGIWMYAVGTTFAKLIHHNGNARDRLLAQHIVDRRWGCTMVLTEPDAGSDVGAARAKATPNPDGSWHVTGVKRFITSGESDLQDNIIHLVLARPQGVPGAGGAGTKGLSLFWMPKYHFDPETGELTGERNGIYATNIEHKMGLKVSNTCELTFGDPQVGGGEPAMGWLLGEAHDGIAQMFDVIEYARMMVGTKAVATLSTGYLNALAYAKERVQGADLTRSSDKTAPRVTITHHPDVRRSLLTQKAAVDGMRALVLYTASWQDRVAMAAHEGDNAADRALAGAVNDLLLPIVKGYGSERSWVLLGTESLQTLGGSGFLSDFPIEQYVRDAKIDTLYEGTTAIQGQDLFFRKIVRNHGQALQHLLGEVSEFAGRVDVGLNRERELLAVALADTQAIVTRMLDDLSAAAEGNERNIYKVGLNTSRLLMVLGDLICAWLLLRQAEVALAGLDRDPSPSDVAFYRGKVTAASWFAHQRLPGVSAERAIVEETDLSAMDLDELSL